MVSKSKYTLPQYTRFVRAFDASEVQVKVLFITQNDPIYVKEFFDELLTAERDDISIAGIVMAPAMGKQSIKELVVQMWNFYGPFDFLRMGIRFVVTRLKALLPKPLRFGCNFTIGQLAEAHGVPVTYVSNLNDPAFVKSVRQQGIDVIVSIAAPQIIKRPLIEAPKRGCINIHNGTLPRYRGMLPNFWQMYDGNRTVGTTVHRMNEAIDDGAILAQEETELLPNESLDGVIRRTKRKGAAVVLQVLRQIRDGTVSEKANNREEGSYSSFPTRDDVTEFRRRGYKLL